MNKNLTTTYVLLLLTILATICLMWGLPFFSTTETRYVEIARKMAESGNYLLPMISYGELFWNKPFLSFALQALSIKAFGINNFAPRLPQALELAMTLYLVLLLAKSELKSAKQDTILAIALSMPIFLIISISVSTDSLLLLAITMTMVGFWYTFVGGRKIFAILFFSGLIIGFFTKGLAIFVFTAIPIFLWCLFTKNLLKFFKEFPLILGSVITCSIIGAWFFVMEKYYTGFTEYFLITEHFGRFFGTPVAMKENYGFFHTKPYGTAILYAFAVFLPYSFYLFYCFLKKYEQKSAFAFLKNQFHHFQFSIFLLCWIGGILGLLVFSSHIILPYVLPIAPALILLVSIFIKKHLNLLKIGLLFTLLLLTIASLFCFIKKDIFVYSFDSGKNYFLPIIEDYQAHLEKNPSLSKDIYQLGGYDFGSSYYSDGAVALVKGFDKLPQGEFFLILELASIYPLPQDDISCTIVGEFPKYNLYYCKKYEDS